MSEPCGIDCLVDDNCPPTCPVNWATGNHLDGSTGHAQITDQPRL